MPTRRRLLARGGAALVALASVPPTARAITPESPEHPYAYFERAAKAWREGDRDDAVFWFYVAQLRYRARLQANPDFDPTGEPALFASLMDSVGRPINEFAFGNVAEATATFDRVLRWDDDHPDQAIPDAIRRHSREGLVGLRDWARREVETIRAERRKNGLDNR